MFVVTRKNTFSPAIEYRDTLHEAQELAAQWTDLTFSQDGEKVTKISIAEELETISVQSY